MPFLSVDLEIFAQWKLIKSLQTQPDLLKKGEIHKFNTGSLHLS